MHWIATPKLNPLARNDALFQILVLLGLIKQTNNTATNCADTKPSKSAGAIPTKVLVKLLANVTAGFAKNVEDVNQ